MFRLILGIIIIIIFFISFKTSKNPNLQKFLKFSFLTISILSILELTIFNYRFYESLLFKEIPIKDYLLGSDLALKDDGYISITAKKTNYLEIKNIYEHLNNLYLNVDTRGIKGVFTIWLGYTDAGNKHYAYTDKFRIMANNKNDGNYLKLHLAGKTSRIKIYFDSEKEIDFKIKDISFNKSVPFTFYLEKIILIYLLASLIYVFRPTSSIYNLNILDVKAKKIIFITACLEIIFFTATSQINRYLINENFDSIQRYQYQYLAESFLKGKTYLDVDPSPLLKELKNPYDKKARSKAFQDLEDNFVWDAAYYNHRYYVYFGVAPVITYYLPYYLLTGYHLKTSTCNTITMILTVIGIYLLLYELAKHYFHKVSLGHFLMLTLLFLNGCSVLAIMARPDHYYLPILMAVMFAIYGLYFWFKAKFTNRKLYFFLGSLFIASIAACRPQILLVMFLAIPLFYDLIFKERKLFSKTSFKETILFILPFVVIAILLMLYNYNRFGSPFDFGANYNLTTNDMTKRGIVIDRIPLGIFYYLFKPITIITSFPFIISEELKTSYLGLTIYEEMTAGFLISNILTFLNFKILSFKKDFQDKSLYYLSLLCVIFSFIIIIADTEMAGILPRYLADFGFLMYLATTLIVFMKLNQNKENTLLHKGIYYAFIFSIVYNFLNIFNDSIILNSDIFFYFEKMFSF